MGGGYQCYIRGIPINVQRTLQVVYDTNQEFSQGDFIQYLEGLNLQRSNNPPEDIRENGFIVLLEQEENTEELGSAYLSTGLRYHQYWALQEWDQEMLGEIIKFLNPEHLEITSNIKRMFEYWSEWFVFDDIPEYQMYVTSSEWVHSYMHYSP